MHQPSAGKQILQFRCGFVAGAHHHQQIPVGVLQLLHIWPHTVRPQIGAGHQDIEMPGTPGRKECFCKVLRLPGGHGLRDCEKHTISQSFGPLCQPGQGQKALRPLHGKARKGKTDPRHHAFQTLQQFQGKMEIPFQPAFGMFQDALGQFLPGRDEIQHQWHFPLPNLLLQPLQ